MQMIKPARQLSTPDAASVQTLIRQCEAVDHASPYIQTDHSLNADQDMDSWFLACEGEELVGVASVFAPTREEAEIALCVSPDKRNRGLGMQLLTQAARYLNHRGYLTLLLVCHTASEPGNRFAARFSRELQHVEYDMRLVPPFGGVPENRLTIREATTQDFPAVKAVCQSAYGEEDRDFDSFLTHSMSLPGRRGYLGLLGGVPATVCFLGTEEHAVSLNTVAVHQSFQGKGYGREFLSALLHRLEGKTESAEISVDSTNEPAFRLYKKLGFMETRAVAYHMLRQDFL
jgi:ribosomal protein S18 acetylase RimI-like enzyme